MTSFSLMKTNGPQTSSVPPWPQRRGRLQTLGWRLDSQPTSASPGSRSSPGGTWTREARSPRSYVWRHETQSDSIYTECDPNHRELMIPEPPVQSQGTDGPPPLLQAAAGLLQGPPLLLSSTRSIFITQQCLAQTEHRGNAFRLLLDVTLQLLDKDRDVNPSC